jgi:hypothetical protein
MSDASAVLNGWRAIDVELIEKYIPRYDVRARYETDVRAPAALTLQIVRRLDLFRPWPVRALFELRRLPTGRADGCVISAIRSVSELELIGAVLDKEPGREIVFGLIGRFWDLRDPTYRTIRPSEFAAFAEPGWAKAVVSLRAEPIDGGTTRLVTETRVVSTDPGSRWRFGLYWAVIERFSGLIRVLWLRAMRAEAERAAVAA